MKRDEAKAQIDKSAMDAVAGLFNNLRINEMGEPREKAIEQFTTGVRNLRRDIESAKAIIDSEFPE